MSGKTAAERLAEKAERIKAHEQAKQQPPAVEHENQVEPRTLSKAANPHVKRVRSTIDLSPMRHAALKTWCNETAVEIGKTRVTTQDVMQALVARLLTNETFSRQVRDDLRMERY